MKVLPTCGKSTVECQSFMVLDILVAIPSSSSTAEGSNHRDLNPPLIIGGPTFISPSVSLSIFRLRVKSYQVLKWTLRIHRHIYSLETVLAGRKPERNWSVARRYSVVRWQHCLLLRLIVDLFSENVRFEVDVNR